MSNRAKEAALKAYPNKPYFGGRSAQRLFQEGYEQAEKDTISLIESRLSELLGDAQPTPILRYELLDLVKKIKDGE